MTTIQRATDKRMKYIFLFLVLTALIVAEVLHAQTSKPQSRFSAGTLKIGVESFLRDRLEETDEFEIASDLQDQIFEEQFVVARCDAAPESLSGNTKIQLIFAKNDKVLRRVYVPVKISIRRKVPVFTRAMQRGEVIQNSDIELKLTDITYQNDEPASTFVGQRLAQNVGKGLVCVKRFLTGTSFIQRGDAVQVVIQSNGVNVTATGVSLDDGRPGQTVRIRRDDSSTIITGVAGEGKIVQVQVTNTNKN